MALCTICTLPARTRRAIDAALFAGLGYRKVAAKFSTSKREFTYTTVSRHRKHAFPEQLRRQPPPPDTKVATNVLDRIESVIAELRTIAGSPQAKRMPSVAIAALKEVLRGLETIGRATGEVPSGGVNVNFFNGVFSREQLESFFDAIKKRPEALALFTRLIDEKLGHRAPVAHVHFVKSDGNGHFAEVSKDGSSVIYPAAEFDVQLIGEVQDVCKQDPQFRDHLLRAITQTPPLLEGENPAV
jgi:hypothetical protein